MLRQYFEHKAERPDALLAMRVGDFYEFYGEDAETAAATLEITLTAREDGKNGRISMAGVPFHSVEKYLARLIQAGHKVALCDQVEDPKQAKGLVKRAVTRVLTPGTLLDDRMLSSGQNNFLAAVCVIDGVAGIATLDPSTGEFLVTELKCAESSDGILMEIARIQPSEMLIPPSEEAILNAVRQIQSIPVTEIGPQRPDRATRTLLEQLQVNSLHGFGCEEKPGAIVAAAMVLDYAKQNRLDLAHVDAITTYSVDGYLAMDPSTRRSLELTQNLSSGSKKYTLLSVLDKTVTAMGSRMMRRWVEQPLLDLKSIHARQFAVQQFHSEALTRADFRESIRGVGDLERMISRCATSLASPRDLAQLGQSLDKTPQWLNTLEPIGFGRIAELMGMIPDLRALSMSLNQALVPEPPLTTREGGIFREGFSADLDALRTLSKQGKQYIATLEAEEKAKTGISSLKIGYNSVFGYYLEVSKRDVEKVPEHFIRKQTTANAERYITADLKEQESAVLSASDKAIQLENDLFQSLRARITNHSAEILKTARALAELDTLSTFAEVAAHKGYTKPEVLEEDILEIRAGRHPVVEDFSTHFVTNDIGLTAPAADDTTQRPVRLMILTGPNMSGKSTYLRQVALIVLMAQIGAYIPAESARIGLCDSIFARIGAKDELALGQSTFMVEMLESAYILNHATPRSLVVLDEVGRGTSTYDGLAIAWAMTEHLADVGAKTLFATHYHQLNVLEGQIPGIVNYRVSVQEIGDSIIWTHKVLAGGTDRSYGIHVARAAGVPQRVLGRASEILSELEQKESAPKPVSMRTEKVQLTLFEADPGPIVRELENLDVNELSPLQALQLLDHWKKSLQ